MQEENRVRTLVEQVDAAYEALRSTKEDMQISLDHMREKEDEVKLANEDEWVGAKNNDIRAIKVKKWLADDAEYQTMREDYNTARNAHRLARIEVERIGTLVQAIPVEIAQAQIDRLRPPLR